jgi:hypothetical protein
MMARGTISATGISTGCTSRSTLAESETCSRRRSAAFWAWRSCVTSRITDMSTMTVMTTKLVTSPANADTAAAKSRIKPSGLLKRSIKADSRCLCGAVSTRFGPSAERMAAAADMLRPVAAMDRAEEIAMLGFKRFRNASITIAGVELMHRIRKRQVALGKLPVAGKTAPEIWTAVIAARH